MDTKDLLIQTKPSVQDAASLAPDPISSLTLLRKIYRVLLNAGRSYAAFTAKEQELIKSLQSNEIFDPMSGYGSLTKYCAEIGVKSYCVEYNLPQYLWQLLCHPNLVVRFAECCRLLESFRVRWPRSSIRAESSNEWFPAESKRILFSLLDLTKESVRIAFGESHMENELTAALLIPFVGRLSCSVPGDIVTHVKRGGICVYRDWETDFQRYLSALIQRLSVIDRRSLCRDHELVHGDARTMQLPKQRFAAFLTSPPYPNHRDFVSMFAPEHTFLDFLKMPGSVTSRRASLEVIGSNFVADRPTRKSTTLSAMGFFEEVESTRRNQTALRHDRQYYFPYFEHYFCDLEDAYLNVSLALKKKCEGYIIVVNNTHRNVIVPVSNVVLEIWQRLGFEATVFEAKEFFHVGTKNPRARGLRARHTEYVIKVSR